MISALFVAAVLAMASSLSVGGAEPQARVFVNGQYWWKYYLCDCPEDSLPNQSSNPDQPLDYYISQCLATADCAGFTTEGILKNASCLANIQYGPEWQVYNLYILETTPQTWPNYAPYIWPLPQQYSMGSANISVNSLGFYFLPNVTSTDLNNAIPRFTKTMFPHLSRSVGPASIDGVHINIANTSVPLQLYADESYTLSIPANAGYIVINAGSVYGAYHALETLSQLIQFSYDSETYYIRGAPWEITDFPRFAHRGLMIDSSRHFEPVESIKRIIDSTTYAKLNVIHWHLVDWQAFPFDSPSFPLLSVYGAYSEEERYTVDDVAEVVEYARQRGIRVMVEIDTPGHAGSWCYGYPEVCPSAFCQMPLNPASNMTLQVLQGLFFDLTGGIRGSGLFFENLMHLGGDEVDTTCWTITPSVQAWLTAHNYTADQGYEYMVSHAQAIAHAYGRDVVGWEEIWDHFGTQLNPSTIIQQWLPGSTIGPEVVAAGYRLLWSTDGVWYLDGLDTTWQEMYLAEPCTNITSTQEHLVLGGEGCMWGETVDTSDFEQTVWPRMGAIAERLWSARNVTDVDTALPRLEWFRCLLNRRGIAAAPVTNAEARESPSGPNSCLYQ